MKKSLYQSKFISLSIVASVCLLLAGCGKTEDTGEIAALPGVVTPPCTGDCGTPPPTDNTWCLNGVADTVGNLYRCTRTVIVPGPKYFSLSGVATVAAPATKSSAGVMKNQFVYSVMVAAGDRLRFEANGSFYNYKGWFKGCGTTPYDVDLNGFDGATPTFNGVQPFTGEPVPRGFLAKIGNRFILLGNFFDDYVETSGNMVFGFNNPWDETCAQLLITRFKHQHCENANGVTQECPFDESIIWL